MIENELRQAELILEALGYCSDQERYDCLLAIVKEILEPYWVKSHPRSLWLKARMPNLGEVALLDEDEFNQQHAELLRLAAESGCPEAQYGHACNLYESNEISKAIEFYFKAAQQDYAPAQWCYGLDVLHGNGIVKNEEIGMNYIRMAAGQRCEYAVEFMLNAHKKGEYGCSHESAELQKWQHILDCHKWD